MLKSVAVTELKKQKSFKGLQDDDDSGGVGLKRQDSGNLGGRVPRGAFGAKGGANRFRKAGLGVMAVNKMGGPGGKASASTANLDDVTIEDPDDDDYGRRDAPAPVGRAIKMMMPILFFFLIINDALMYNILFVPPKPEPVVTTDGGHFFMEMAAEYIDGESTIVFESGHEKVFYLTFKNGNMTFSEGLLSEVGPPAPGLSPPLPEIPPVGFGGNILDYVFTNPIELLTKHYQGTTSVGTGSGADRTSVEKKNEKDMTKLHEEQKREATTKAEGDYIDKKLATVMNFGRVDEQDEIEVYFPSIRVDRLRTIALSPDEIDLAGRDIKLGDGDIDAEKIGRGTMLEPIKIIDLTFPQASIDRNGFFDAREGSILLNDGQISGDKIRGGSITTIHIQDLDCDYLELKGELNFTGGELNFSPGQIKGADIRGGVIDYIEIYNLAADYFFVNDTADFRQVASLLFATDAISGDYVEGGIIDEITIESLQGRDGSFIGELDLRDSQIRLRPQQVSSDFIGPGSILQTNVEDMIIDGELNVQGTLDVTQANEVLFADGQISGDKIRHGTIDIVTIAELWLEDGIVLGSLNVTTLGDNFLIADDQISGDKVEGGRIENIYIEHLNVGNVTLESFAYLPEVQADVLRGLTGKLEMRGRGEDPVIFRTPLQVDPDESFTRPECIASRRGYMWYSDSIPGEDSVRPSDTFDICTEYNQKYDWRPLISEDLPPEHGVIAEFECREPINRGNTVSILYDKIVKGYYRGFRTTVEPYLYNTEVTGANTISIPDLGYARLFATGTDGFIMITREVVSADDNNVLPIFAEFKISEDFDSLGEIIPVNPTKVWDLLFPNTDLFLQTPPDRMEVAALSDTLFVVMADFLKGSDTGLVFQAMYISDNQWTRGPLFRDESNLYEFESVRKNNGYDIIKWTDVVDGGLTYHKFAVVQRGNIYIGTVDPTTREITFVRTNIGDATIPGEIESKNFALGKVNLDTNTLMVTYTCRGGNGICFYVGIVQPDESVQIFPETVDHEAMVLSDFRGAYPVGKSRPFAIEGGKRVGVLWTEAEQLRGKLVDYHFNGTDASYPLDIPHFSPGLDGQILEPLFMSKEIPINVFNEDENRFSLPVQFTNAAEEDLRNTVALRVFRARDAQPVCANCPGQSCLRREDCYHCEDCSDVQSTYAVDPWKCYAQSPDVPLDLDVCATCEKDVGNPEQCTQYTDPSYNHAAGSYWMDVNMTIPQQYLVDMASTDPVVQATVLDPKRIVTVTRMDTPGVPGDHQLSFIFNADVNQLFVGLCEKECDTGEFSTVVMDGIYELLDVEETGIQEDLFERSEIYFGHADGTFDTNPELGVQIGQAITTRRLMVRFEPRR